MHHKYFVPFEQAFALHKLGYGYNTLTFYDNYGNLNKNDDWFCGFSTDDLKKRSIYCCLAPIYQQAFDWMRSHYKLSGIIKHYSSGTFSYDVSAYIIPDGKQSGQWERITPFVGNTFFKHDDAQFELLKQLIELAQTKK